MDPKALRVLEYEKIIEMLCRECSSSLTREQAGHLLPLDDIGDVEEALMQTDEAYSVLMQKGMPPLGNFYDVAGLAHLAGKDGTLNHKQLLEVAYNLQAARRTAAFLSSDLPELPYIDGLVSAIAILKGLEDEIYRCIISEDEMADDASPELRRLRKAIIKQNESIRVKLNQIVNSADNKTFLQDAIVTQRQGRYVVPVKLEHKSRLAGIVHDQSSSGQTLFVEPTAIVNMNNELRELELKEHEEIVRILKELSGRVGEDEAQIKGNQRVMTALDFAFAKARLAVNMNGMKPEISEKFYVNIRKGRHPLIDQKKVVPIDVSVGDKYRTLIVTGPNTGGKTVTLKTIGLLCLMAQSGLFIPASDGTVIPVFYNVFADIGDEQSIEQSLSTFSSHMNNIVKIVNGASRGNLVLLDELGAGTDPTEGAALAMSILTHLFDKGAVTVATTHYTELKKYAISTPGVQNASMEFDVETLSPTYRLIIGTPGKSNAFEISQKLGLKKTIIEHAKLLLESGDIEFEEVITSLENDRREAERKLAEAERINEEMKAQKERFDALESKLKAQREKYISDAKEEARELLEEARAEIEEIREAIKNAQVSDELKRAVDEGRASLKGKKDKYADRIEKQENNAVPKAEEIAVGKRVNVLSVGQKGEVLSLPDDKGNLQVQIGSMKLSVNLKDVTLVKENVTDKEREKIKYSKLKTAKAMSVPLSINVVGQNLDDASMNVDKYLDDAFLAGLETVTVIHGRGAGILKNGLQKMFKNHKHVASFRSGGYKEGGDGVTVVTLKK
ncbi:MAG: endonuclease MutS2 [Firmicutes bacterium]|nr:endonuclease MutS2 [Bacillota bacterium]